MIVDVLEVLVDRWVGQSVLGPLGGRPVDEECGVLVYLSVRCREGLYALSSWHDGGEPGVVPCEALSQAAREFLFFFKGILSFCC